MKRASIEIMTRVCYEKSPWSEQIKTLEMLGKRLHFSESISIFRLREVDELKEKEL